MNYFHLYVDETGESHWRDVEVTLQERSFAPPAADIHISDTQPATGTLFLRLRAGWNEPIHPTPRSQYIVCLRGAARVTASDGDMRVIGPGDVWLMSDTHGTGHNTQVISEDAFECVMVQLP